MKLSKLVGERLKETSTSITCKSHKFMLRAGFMKQVSNGIYTLTMPAQRVSKKIQNIIRQEMDKIDGQEVLFPVVMPKEMWETSGRYSSIGNEMVRFKDRTQHEMLLGMTHEEAAVHLCNNTVKSYEQLPFMIYQIQTKFRDEARPRAGLIRVREFTMKDAYSFHTSQDNLQQYYKKVYDAYNTIYKRIGMKNFVAIESDSGMMGGKVAHEFQLLTDVGEDSIVVCDSCNYKSNLEVAVGKLQPYKNDIQPLEEVCTGEAKEIADVCKCLNIEPHQTCKAVCFGMEGDSTKTVIAFIRGDREVNEVKLSNVLGKKVEAKDISSVNLVAGNIGCLNLNLPDCIIVYDSSLQNENSLVTGSNKEHYHIKGLCPKRDLANVVYNDISKIADGDECIYCGGKLNVARGIEIGNIFQLGTKYTKSMGMTIAMQDGTTINPIMGCYGIGVGRCIASIAEEGCDEKGLVWPMAVAPWQVYLCPLKLEDETVLKATQTLYEALREHNIECLYDDRLVSAGIKFTDSELMGIPIRIVISPKSLANGEIEFSVRETAEKQMLKVADAVEFITKFVFQKMS